MTNTKNIYQCISALNTIKTELKTAINSATGSPLINDSTKFTDYPALLADNAVDITPVSASLKTSINNVIPDTIQDADSINQYANKLDAAVNTLQTSLADSINGLQSGSITDDMKMSEYPGVINTIKTNIDERIANGEKKFIEFIQGDYLTNTTYEIPDSVTKLGKYVFYSTSLTQITGGENLTSIGMYAFYGSKLTSINLPNVEDVGMYAFQKSTALTTVNLPKAKYIKYYGFRDCTNLASISIPNVEIIYDAAFNSCSKLTSIDLPKLKKIVGDYIFNSSGITSLELPSVTSMDSGVFYQNSKIQTVSLPACNGLYGKVFYYSGIASVDLPVCEYISGNGETFEYCSKLTTINMPKIKYLGNYTFYSCSSLANVEIPSTCISIGNYAFYNCSKLTQIIIRCTTPPTLGGTSAFTKNTGLKIYVPNGCAATYKAATNWSSYSTYIYELDEDGNIPSTT